MESKTLWYILVSSGAQKTLPLFTRASVEAGVVRLSSCVLALQRLPCRIRYCAGSKRITSVVAASPAYGQCHLSPVDTVCVCAAATCLCVGVKMHHVNMDAYVCVLVKIMCVRGCEHREQVVI